MTTNLANASIHSTITSGVGVTRTLGDRWSDVKNVRDFGAKGDGTPGDDVFIQAAVDYASSPSYSSANRGIIFFPPGIYQLLNPITFNKADGVSFISFIGASGAKIRGSFPDALLKRDIHKDGPIGGIYTVENLALENNDPSGKAVMMQSTIGAKIVSCQISSATGIECWSSQSVMVDNCSLTSNGYGGGIGIIAGNATTVIATDVTGFSEGLRHFNVGLSILGGRFEVSTIGVNLGVDYRDIASGTYNNGTGVVTLSITSAPPPDFTVGKQLTALGIAGTGAVSSLEGIFTATGVTYPILTYNAGAGLGAIAINDGVGTITVGNNTIAEVSGTYNNGSGIVTLLVTPNFPGGFTAGNTIVVAGLTGTGAIASLNGSFTIASTTLATVTYTAASGLGAIAITDGSIGPKSQSSAVFLSGISAESNKTTYLLTQSSTTFLCGCPVGNAQAGPNYGIRILGGDHIGLYACSCSTSNADWSGYGISIEGGDNITMHSCKSVDSLGARAWNVGSGMDVEFTNCDAPLPTFTQLPAPTVSPFSRRVISDGPASPAFGDKAGHNSPGFPAPVWTDGSDWRYG